MKLIHLLPLFHTGLGLLLALLYAYQAGYLAVGLFRPRGKPPAPPKPLRRYAALIAARNEEGVIGELIASLKAQDYPRELLDIYVVADNCTDSTALTAQRAGARVFRRFNRMEVGKGYALDFLLKRLAAEGLEGQYEGYFIFDADNIVDPGFVSQMNASFDPGEFAALTCYRNSKNFGQNWITAAYSIWFLREARFVNAARMTLGLTCHVSGTGFLISAAFLREKGGWPYHLLTEDIQFSADCAAMGRRIGYCAGAVIYDEQPTSFRQSWRQRLRWSKGFYQVDRSYALPLLRGMLAGGRRGFGCYDILMTVTPGVLLTVLGGASQLASLLALLASPGQAARQVLSLTGAFLLSGFWTFYRGMLLYGALTVLCEWKHIRAKAWQKVIYLPLFPVFMLTYLPISVAAIFQKVEWQPITHRSLAQLDQAA